MTTVSVSSKFQIVIPKEIRETLHIEQGMKMEMIPYDGHLELILLKPMEMLRGSLKGIDTTVIREKDRI